MHQPVLFNEVVEFLRPARDDGTLVDATVGLGGHAEGLLERYPATRLIAIDRDPRALERSRERLRRFGERVAFVQGRHEQLIEILRQSGVENASGVLADLGVSSMQLDDAIQFRITPDGTRPNVPQVRGGAIVDTAAGTFGSAYGVDPCGKQAVYQVTATKN